MMIAVSHFNPVFLQRLTTKVDLSHMVQTSGIADEELQRWNATRAKRYGNTKRV